MAPKKAAKRRAPKKATAAHLLEKNLDAALNKRLTQSAQQLGIGQSKLPDILAETDQRLNAFTGRQINFDVDSTQTISHPPLAVSDALIFRIKTESDLLLDSRSLNLYLRCSIKRIDGDNRSVKIDPPVRGAPKFAAATHEQVEVSDQLHTVVVDGEERRLPILTRKSVAIAKEIDSPLTGLGVSPSPIFPLTLWKNVRLKLGANKVEIPNSARDMYFYQVYWLQLMQTKIEAIANQLRRSAMFILDNTPSVDPFSEDTGLSRRYRAAANSRVMEFCLPFHCDGLTNLDGAKFLPNNFDIQIELEKADDEIILTSNKHERFHIEIHEIYLQGQYTRLSAGALLAYNQTISKIAASYTYTNHLMSYRLISEGAITFRMQIEDSLDNRLPERLFGFFVSLKSFKGRFDKNAFWFENFGLKKLSVASADGKRILDLQADFTNDKYQMFYNAMVSELNTPLTTGDMQLLDHVTYNNGRFFFTIDCSRNHAADTHDSVPIISKWELNLEFKEKLAEDLVLVLMYFETHGHSVDGGRNVTVHSYH